MKFKDIYGDEIEITTDYGKVIFNINSSRPLDDNSLHFDEKQAKSILDSIELNILKARVYNDSK